MSKVTSRKNILGTMSSSLLLFAIIVMIGGSMPAGTLPIQTLDKGDQAQMIVESDLITIINTDEELEEFYAQLGIGVSAPDINMDEVSVIAVVASPRPTSGYEIEISRLEEMDNQTVDLHIRESIPGPNCITLAVQTIPYHVIVTPRKVGADLNRINRTETVVDCK